MTISNQTLEVAHRDGDLPPLHDEIETKENATTDGDETVLRPPSGWMPVDIEELLRYRDLLWMLSRRDIIVRYKQSAMGSAWAVLQPLSMMIIFTVVFGVIAKMPSAEIPYPVFVLAGLIPWAMFSQGITKAAVSISSEYMVSKIYFPRMYLPAAAVNVFTVDLLISLGLYAVVLLIYRIPPAWTVVFLPILIFLTYIATLGVSLIFSSTMVFYRDVGLLVPYLTQFLMFLTPVVYPLSIIKDPAVRYLLALNPMFGIVSGYRSAILGVEWDPVCLVISTVSTIAIFVGSLVYFRRLEPYFIDVV
jgi:lipopolysaccharide transport system permease protein